MHPQQSFKRGILVQYKEGAVEREILSAILAHTVQLKTGIAELQAQGEALQTERLRLKRLNTERSGIVGENLGTLLNWPTHSWSDILFNL